MFRTVNSRKADLWRSRLRRFQESGLSVTRFCQVEQVSAPAFYHWRKRLGASPGAEAPPTFVPVRLTPGAVVEIHLPNGARVCVPAGHADSLRMAIETAGRLSGSPPEADAC
jgi:hypothetical protein